MNNDGKIEEILKEVRLIRRIIYGNGQLGLKSKVDIMWYVLAFIIAAGSVGIYIK